MKSTLSPFTTNGGKVGYSLSHNQQSKHYNNITNQQTYNKTISISQQLIPLPSKIAWTWKSLLNFSFEIFNAKIATKLAQNNTETTHENHQVYSLKYLCRNLSDEIFSTLYITRSQTALYAPTKWKTNNIITIISCQQWKRMFLNNFYSWYSYNALLV